jgi:hypothetical protein
MTEIGIYVPTLGRPHALQRVADNIHANTETPHEIVFVTEPHDRESYDAAAATGETVVENRYEPSYSNALQTAYELFDHRFFIGANDDFDFQPGWDTAALEAMIDGVHVVGLNDGSPGCQFTTISLVRRSYIEQQSGVIDMPNRVNFPYAHNYVDTEFYCTAVHRGVFKAAPDSRVHHKHPDWGHAADDATYRKSRASLGEDAATFQARSHLWTM